MKPSNFAKAFVLLLLLTATHAFGQSSVVGVVTDAVTKDALPGADVYIPGTSLGSATSLDGYYQIKRIPPGDYTLRVSYLGYQTKDVPVSVVAGSKITVDVALSAETIQGETVTVTAQAEGQLAAINQQLSSDKIANIVSEQKIQELPDFNAAAALSRLPGISTQKSSGEDNKVVIRGLAPKYNSIEIEGVKLSATGSSSIGLTSDVYVATGGVQNDRSVDLTMVSPYMIRTIAVYKSLTPDMNANSIGGTVNMELREAPSGFHMNFRGQQGYTAKSNTYGNYRITGSASNRIFSDKLGLYALVNAESYDRDADNLNANYDEASTIKDSLTGFRPVKVLNVTFNRHIETRDRFTGNLIMDYDIPNGSLKFVNVYTRLNSDYIEHRQTIDYNAGRLNWRLQQGENITDQRLHSLKLDYDLGSLTADLSVSYTAASNVLKDSPVLNFNQVAGVKIEDRDNVVPQNLGYLHQYAGNDEVVLRSGNLFSNDYQEDKLTYKADFELPFNLGSAVSGFFKFGGQLDRQSNSTDQETPYLGFDGDVSGDTTAIANNMMRTLQRQFGIAANSRGEFAGTTFLNSNTGLFDPFLSDRYGDIFYAADPTLLTRILRTIVGNPAFDASDVQLSNGRSGGWYDGLYQQLVNDYNFDEDYYAAYAMTNFSWSDFTVIGGARYEKVRSNYFAYNAIDQRNVQIQKMYDTTSVNETEFLLPMGQIKYTPLSWLDVRYAYTQTLSRPDYQLLSPKFTVEQGGNVRSGNANLRPAKSFNHDLSFAFHSNKLGLFTISGFHKTIEDFAFTPRDGYFLQAAADAGIDSLANYQVIENGMVVLQPPSQRVTVFRPQNNPFDATVKGVEFDFQHNFWYMPAPFDDIVLSINYTRIMSKSRYPYYDTRSEGRPPMPVLIDSSFVGRLIDQPNHVLNASVGYDYKGFSIRLSFVFQDNSARANGGRFPENDSFTDNYFRMDLSASQVLPYFNSQLFMDVSNLNDQNTSWVQRSTRGYQGIENYGLTANVGLRVRY